MKVTLAYDRDGLEVDLPDGNVAAVLRKPAAEPLADPDETLRAALAEPLGRRALEELAAGKKDAVIVVSDVTRPMPNRFLLPPIVEALRLGGLPDERITILIATGLHGPNEGEVLEEMLGPEIVSSVRVLNHDARDVDSHVRLGRTERDTEVHVDRRYVEADLKILTGLIEPHFMAGYSGGAKAVAPGLAAAETIARLHGWEMLSDERCTTGRTEDNPLQDEVRRITEITGADFLCNVTLDEARRVTGVFCGELIVAHEAGCAHAARECTAHVEAPVDIAISSSAGYPLDTTFYQAAKGIFAPIEIVRPGGMIVAVAGCADGIGSAEFEEFLMDTGTADAARERLMRPGEWTIDQWNAQMMLRAAERADVFFYTGAIDPQTLGRCLVTPVGSVEEAVEIGLDRYGAGASIAVIPEGPYVYATVRDG